MVGEHFLHTHAWPQGVKTVLMGESIHTEHVGRLGSVPNGEGSESDGFDDDEDDEDDDDEDDGAGSSYVKSTSGGGAFVDWLCSLNSVLMYRTVRLSNGVVNLYGAYSGGNGITGIGLGAALPEVHWLA